MHGPGCSLITETFLTKTEESWKAHSPHVGIFMGIQRFIACSVWLLEQNASWARTEDKLSSLGIWHWGSSPLLLLAARLCHTEPTNFRLNKLVLIYCVFHSKELKLCFAQTHQWFLFLKHWVWLLSKKEMDVQRRHGLLETSIGSFMM